MLLKEESLSLQLQINNNHNNNNNNSNKMVLFQITISIILVITILISMEKKYQTMIYFLQQMWKILVFLVILIVSKIILQKTILQCI